MTLAVNVTDWPKTEEVGLAAIAVLVVAWETVSAVDAELVPKLESPL